MVGGRESGPWGRALLISCLARPYASQTGASLPPRAQLCTAAVREAMERHMPEVGRMLASVVGEPVEVSFVELPSALPMELTLRFHEADEECFSLYLPARSPLLCCGAAALLIDCPEAAAGLIASSVLREERLYQRMFLSLAAVERCEGPPSEAWYCVALCERFRAECAVMLHRPLSVSLPRSDTSLQRFAHPLRRCPVTAPLVLHIAHTLLYRAVQRPRFRCRLSQQQELNFCLHGFDSLQFLLTPSGADQTTITFEVRGNMGNYQTKAQVPAEKGEVLAVEAKVAAQILVGELTLTIGELLELQPGCRLSFNCSREAPVQLAIGGEPVASVRFLLEEGEGWIEIVALNENDEEVRNGVGNLDEYHSESTQP